MIHDALYGVRVDASEPSTLTESHGLDETASSHGITAAASEASISGHPERFLELRLQRLREATESFTNRLAAWSRSDRPSIDHILESAE